MGDAVKLGDLRRQGVRKLIVNRNRADCRRYGGLSIARLIAERGADIGLPDLGLRVGDDCERRKSPFEFERCRAIFKYAGMPVADNGPEI